jgi:hypothetical protein
MVDENPRFGEGVGPSTAKDKRCNCSPFEQNQVPDFSPIETAFAKLKG